MSCARSEAPDDWRALPAPLIAADDPAAAFLASLAWRHRTRRDPRAPRARTRAHGRGAAARARTLYRGRRSARRRRQLLDEIALADPWEWRVAWSTGVACARRRPTPAARSQEFRGVYASLPGELAPKLALAYAAESGERPGARRALVRHRRLAPIRGSRPPSSGWRAVGSARRPRRRDRGVRPDPVDLELVRRRADRQGRHHARRRRPRAARVDDVVARGRRRRCLPLRHEQRAARPPERPGPRWPRWRSSRPTAPDGPDRRWSSAYALTERDVRLGLERPTDARASSHRRRERIALVDRANELRPRTCCERRRGAAVPSVRAAGAGRRPILRGVRRAAHAGRGRRRPTGVEFDDGTVGGVTDRGHQHRRNEDAMQVSASASVSRGRVRRRVVVGRRRRRGRTAAAAAARRGARAVRSTTAMSTATRAMRAAVTAARDAVVQVPWTRTRRSVAPACTFLGAACGRPRHHRRGGGRQPRLLGRRPTTVEQLTRRRLVGAGAGRRGPVEPRTSGAPTATRHAITRWLGEDAPGERSRSDHFVPPPPGRLVLCSDGLWNYAPAPGPHGCAGARLDAASTPAIDVARALTTRRAGRRRPRQHHRRGRRCRPSTVTAPPEGP